MIPAKTVDDFYELLKNLGKLGNVGIARTRLERLLRMFNPVDALFQSSQVELFLSTGMSYYNLNLKRLTLLKRILRQELYGIYSTNMFLVVLEDLKLLNSIINPRTGSTVTGGSFLLNNVNFIFSPKSIEHIFRNYSTAASRGLARVFKQYAHNNHLLVQVLRNPEKFADVLYGLGLSVNNLHLELTLESLSVRTSKISDLTIWILNVPPFNISFNGRNIILNIPNLKIPLTYDSKVFGDPVAGIAGAFEQQMELFFSDRIRDILKPMLKEIDKLNESDQVRKEFLEKYIPILFRHFIFVPNDFPDTDEISSEFATTLLNHLRPELERHMGKRHKDLNLVYDVFEKHILSFFGTGEFIKKESLMSYAWQIN